MQQHGQLRVQGNRIVDKNGQPVKFNGMALYWSQWKPAFYNASCVNWLVNDWKCSIVRPSIAVGSGGYLTNPTAETNKAKAVRFSTLEALCRELKCQPGDLLEFTK